MKIVPRNTDHIVKFVESFVQNERKNRWLYLLEKDTEKLRMNSSKILKDLDAKFVVRDDDLKGIPSHKIKGVFYNIGDQEAKEVSLEEIVCGKHYFFDAIFSIEAGKKAIFLFHERENYVLNRQ